MIGQITRITAVLLISGVLFSCSVKAPKMDQDAGRSPEIQDIRITEGNGKTIIEIEGEEEMIYTTFQLTDPNRLIIDIAGIGLGAFAQERQLENGPIRAIRPVSGGGSNVVRLELLLDEAVEAAVSSEGPNLVIDAAEPGRMKSKFVFFGDGTGPVKTPEENSGEKTVQTEAEGLDFTDTGIDPLTTLSLAPAEEATLAAVEEVSDMPLEQTSEKGLADQGMAEDSPIETDLNNTADRLLPVADQEVPEVLEDKTSEMASASPQKALAGLSEQPAERSSLGASEPPPLVPMLIVAEDEQVEAEPSLEKAIEETPEVLLEVPPENLEVPLEVEKSTEGLEASTLHSDIEETPAALHLAETHAHTEETSEDAALSESPMAKLHVEEAVESEKPLSVATRVSDIRFVKDEALRLIISLDGTLRPRFFRIDKKRLIIDLLGVKTALKHTKVLAKDPLVKQVRIGKHAKKLRLVVDLNSDASYAWEQHQAELAITFRDPSVLPVVVAAAPFSLSASEKAISSPPPPLVSNTGLNQKEQVPEDQKAKQSDHSSHPLIVPIVSHTEEDAAVKAAAAAKKKVETAREKRIRKKTFLRRRRAQKIEKGKNLFVQKKRVEEILKDSPKPKYVGKKISLDFQDAEISNVIRLIADVSRLNFVMGEDIKGKVSLKLSNVPWDQALDIILEMNSLGKVQQGNIIRIASLANLTKQRDEMARAKETQVNSADLLTRVIYVNYGKATESKVLLEKLLSPRGEIMVDKRTNAMIVKDIEANLDQVERLAEKLDTKTPQVLIEARIAEVKPSFKKSLGIKWGADFKTTRGGNILGVGSPSATSPINAPTPDFAVNLPASTNLGGLGFTFGRFSQSPFTLDLRLSAGEVQSTTRVVSSPKIMVLDNHEALIEQGESIPFQTSAANTGTKTQFIDANMTLKVTPHISPDGGILLDVMLTKNQPALTTEAGAPGPRIFKKEITTKILLMDGETIVIGGIYESQSSKAESGIPWLKDLPGIGWLFKSKETSKSISELLVFITPTIMD